MQFGVENTISIVQLFDKHNEDVAARVGISVSASTLQKYKVCKRRFSEFLKDKLRRSDLKLTELTYMIIHDFDLYLRTVVGQNPNTATKTIKTFKTVVILGQKVRRTASRPFCQLSTSLRASELRVLD